MKTLITLLKILGGSILAMCIEFVWFMIVYIFKMNDCMEDSNEQKEPDSLIINKEEPLNNVTEYYVVYQKGKTIKTVCAHCDFHHAFIDGHTSQYIYCPRCGRKIEWGRWNEID